MVRQSQIYSFQQVSIPVSSIKFKVLMCNPVLQGIISSNTNFIITNLLQETLIYDNEEGEININNHDIADFYFEDYLDEPNILNSKDYYMETQLALLEVNGQDTGNGSESDWTTSASSISSDEDCLNNVVSISRKSTFTPQILSSPFPVSLIQPIPKEREDPESRVLISLKDLAKLGIQSGSWVRSNFIIFATFKFILINMLCHILLGISIRSY